MGHLGPLLSNLWQGNTEVRTIESKSLHLLNLRRFRSVVEGASRGGSACPGQAEEDRVCATSQCPGKKNVPF